jgi:chromosome segregation ATPase
MEHGASVGGHATESKIEELESQNEDLRKQLEFTRKDESRLTLLQASCERLTEENGKLKLDLSNLEANIKSDREDSAKDAKVRLENLLASVNIL